MQAAGHENVRHILVISASRDDRRTLMRLLQDADCDVDTCVSLKIGLRNIKETHVIVCDDRSPDGDWRTLLARSLAVRGRPKFILISDVVDQRTCADALSRGAYDVLTRPLEPDSVLWVLDSARPEPDSVPTARNAGRRRRSAGDDPDASRIQGSAIS
jgi:DNA-binding NtrC family response regulator